MGYELNNGGVKPDGWPRHRRRDASFITKAKKHPKLALKMVGSQAMKANAINLCFK